MSQSSIDSLQAKDDLLKSPAIVGQEGIIITVYFAARARARLCLSQAEAPWESKSQIAGLACQDIRYKGPVYQTVRQNKNNNQSTHKIRINERSPSRATVFSKNLGWAYASLWSRLCNLSTPAKSPYCDVQ